MAESLIASSPEEIDELLNLLLGRIPDDDLLKNPTLKEIFHDQHHDKDHGKNKIVWQQLGLAVNAMKDGFFLWDTDDRLLVANEAMKDVFPGIKDPVGKTAHELFLTFARTGVVPPAVGREEEWVEEQLANRKNELGKEIVFQTSDGRWIARWDHMTENGLRVSVRSDVTEQKNRESVLESVVANAEEGILITNSDHTITVASDRYCKMFGIDAQALKEMQSLGEPIRFDLGTLKILQDGEADIDVYAATLPFNLIEEASGKSIDVELPNGNVYRFKCKVLPDGQLLHSYFDLTKDRQHQRELQEARAALQEHEVLMEEALEVMVQGILVCDEEKIILANERIAEVTNIPAEYFEIGRDWTDYLRYSLERGDFGEGEEAKHRFDNIILSASTGEGTYIERTTGDGRYVAVTANARDCGGRVVTYVDITETKEREFQLEEALTSSKAADRAKSEFLANMSHEIRTPMNGVMGMAELLARTQLDTKQKTFTDIIVKSGAALLTIINDILDFSKIDAGQMELDPAPFRLHEAIEDVATLVSSRAVEKDLELAVRIDPHLSEMFVGDVGRLRQIVTNLLGNAVKFTDHGHVYINVTGEEQEGDEPASKLRFSITDTGIGIPEEKRAKVFEKFSQVDESATRKHEGTGLGLAIASSLVELMGGEIGVDSIVGEGSTFWFSVTLPIHQGGSTRNRVPVDVSGSRVLIIDDNEVNREILSEQMASWKFDSAACRSGSEALMMMRAAHEQGVTIDVVILDYHMPEMNGADVARIMAADEDLTDIPIIMLTSVDQMDDGSLFSSLRIQGHLTKPARSSLMLETLVHVLQDSREDYTEAFEGIRIAKALGGYVEKSAVTQINPANISNEDRIDILIAEDNEVNQIVFTQILETSGYSFKIASNGVEALEMYERYQPKLICMDVSMPQMNGHEATQEIRKREQDSDRHTPIIGVTAHAIKGDREKCIEAGMDDYLSKPVSPNALEEKIHRWIGNENDQSGAQPA
ncbi:MAG: response regulator [Rhizobiaceae bacterium]|nr:response regulator [Rhizobiaceae bacterium]